MLRLGIIQSICFSQVNVSFINFSANFASVIGKTCFLSYVMLISEIDLLLAANCIKCVLLKFI